MEYGYYNAEQYQFGDVLFVQREGYTSLDLISDIGGMRGLLFMAISSVVLDHFSQLVWVAIVNYNQLEKNLVSKLFLRRKN